MFNAHSKSFLILILIYIIHIKVMVSLEINNTKKFIINLNDTYEQEEENDIILNGFLFIFASVSIGVFIGIIINSFHVPFPFRVILLLIGILFGIFAIIFPELKKYTKITTIDPKYIMMMFFPILIFCTSFNIDPHLFVKSYKQIAILSIPGFILTSFISGIMMMLVLDLKLSWLGGFLFGVICSTTNSVKTVKMLDHLGVPKHLSILLEGEGVITSGTAIILFHIITGILNSYLINEINVLFVFFRFTIGGLIFGFIIGKLTCSIIKTLFNDVMTVLTLTLVVAYMTYYIAEEVIYVSGVLSIVVVGIMTSKEKSALTTEVDQCLYHLWNVLAFISEVMIFIMSGIILTEQSSSIRVQNIALVIVTYCIVNISRFVMIIILAPILSRVGYGLTWKSAIITMWGGLRSAISLCLSLMVLRMDKLEDFGKILIVHVTGLVVLSLLINATTMNLILNMLGLTDISLSRQMNMMTCLQYIMQKRDQFIYALKMDRFLSDANWSLIDRITRLKHPYEIEFDEENNENVLIMDKYGKCPDCEKELLREPTKAEYREMEREMKLRILTIKKKSYGRQYATGMISREAFKILNQNIDLAWDSKTLYIEIDGLFQLWEDKGPKKWIRMKLYNWYSKEQEIQLKAPRTRFRRICYTIITHQAFNWTVYVIIILHSIQIISEIVLRLKFKITMGLYWVFLLLNHGFFINYLMEFIIKIFGYSYKLICKDGFGTYFRSNWDVLDFAVINIAFVDLILEDWVCDSLEICEMYMIIIRSFRMLRLLTIIRTLLPQVVITWDTRLNNQAALGFDIAKGYLTGEEDVLKALEGLSKGNVVQTKLRERVDFDRLRVTRELGRMQRERPNITVMVKTYQAARAILYLEQDTVCQLRDDGWFDSFEFKQVQKNLEERFHYLKTHTNSIQPSTPQDIFKEISWLIDDVNLFNFLYENIYTKVFNEGETVYKEGMKSEGIYILIKGVIKINYIPNVSIVNRKKIYGQLPIIDYISVIDFDEPFEDYIVSGNTIGELATLTERPYDCQLTADTPCFVCVLPHSVISQALLAVYNDTNQSLEERMWKFVALPLATTILSNVIQYQNWTREKIRLLLQRAFVPTLTNFTCIMVNNMIEDVVLIEGVVRDKATEEVYKAPCYIPRSVRTLYLENNGTVMGTKIFVKLLIISVEGTNDYKIIMKNEGISEMISTASVRCLQHTVKNKLSTLKQTATSNQNIPDKVHKRPRRKMNKLQFHTPTGSEEELQVIKLSSSDKCNN